MTSAAATGRGRGVRLVLWALAVLAVSLVAVAVLKGSLTYYRTPTELASSPTGGSTVRLEGLVLAGSVRHDGDRLTFVLTDGASRVQVLTDDQPPGTFRPGQDAVVEGRMGADHVFVADRVLVRHSNEYRSDSVTGP